MPTIPNIYIKIENRDQGEHCIQRLLLDGYQKCHSDFDIYYKATNYVFGRYNVERNKYFCGFTSYFKYDETISFKEFIKKYGQQTLF